MMTMMKRNKDDSADDVPSEGWVAVTLNAPDWNWCRWTLSIPVWFLFIFHIFFIFSYSKFCIPGRMYTFIFYTFFWISYFKLTIYMHMIRTDVADRSLYLASFFLYLVFWYDFFYVSYFLNSHIQISF